MKYRIRWLHFSCAILCSIGTVHATRITPPAPIERASEATSPWIVDRADNICGLDDPRMLSKPVRVDYDALLRATPEMKKMRDEKIDPNSSEGIQLRQAAVDRVRKACEKVRQSGGHCSVWKQIRHQDGRTIPDVSDLVREQL